MTTPIIWTWFLTIITTFGEEAYASWAGYHATSLALSNRPCEELLSLDEDQLEDLAEGLSHYESLDWDDLYQRAGAAKSCALVAERIGERVDYWLKSAEPSLNRSAQSRAARLPKMRC